MLKISIGPTIMVCNASIHIPQARTNLRRRNFRLRTGLTQENTAINFAGGYSSEIQGLVCEDRKPI